jgi:thioredoxin reductase (NADPH)
MHKGGEMGKPVLFVIDDEPEDQQAFECDLRMKYAETFQVLQAHSGQRAFEILKQLKLRNESVALFLVDQHMPGMNGVEFFEQARHLFPDAKRILTASYADGDDAIKAINKAQIDYYLVKPWDPPAEHLYPVLQDLLDDWAADYRPPFEGIRVIGHQWSALSHDLKDFLARNQIPYRWLDIETHDEAHILVEHVGLDVSRLPLLLFPDGTHLAQPTHLEIAEKVGLETRASRPYYDLIVVGAGPAGLAAAVYGASEGLRTALIEREAPGGQAGTSSRIENYLGFPVGLSGSDLARRAVEQAERFGVEIISPQEVTCIQVQDPYRIVTLGDGSELSCHALLLATGVSYRKLDVPSIDKLTGAGVYYGAAMTEAFSIQGQDVFIVGGANSAGQAALYFSRFARSVTVLLRGDSLAKDMSEYLIAEIGLTGNIDVLVNTSVVEAHGDTSLEAITIANSKTGETKTVPAKALFIFIGAMPRTDWLPDRVERDGQGFILSGPTLLSNGLRMKGWTLDRDPFLLETGVPGIFVAGDVRSGSVKRVASGVGEGSIAVQFIHHYLSEAK